MSIVFPRKAHIMHQCPSCCIWQPHLKLMHLLLHESSYLVFSFYPPWLAYIYYTSAYVIVLNRLKWIHPPNTLSLHIALVQSIQIFTFCLKARTHMIHSIAPRKFMEFGSRVSQGVHRLLYHRPPTLRLSEPPFNISPYIGDPQTQEFGKNIGTISM